MTNARRLALIMIAAQVVIAQRALAQSAGGNGGRTGAAARGADDEDDEDDEDTATPARRTPPAGTAATTTTTTAPATDNGAPPGAVHAADRNWDFATNETETEAEARRERMLWRFSSLTGSIGLLHLATAEAGGDQTFRFGLIGEYWGGTGFLHPAGQPASMGANPIPVDHANHIGATLTLSYSPVRYIDIFAGLRSYANANDTERPGLFQVLGDTDIGIKAIYPLFRGFSAGLEASMYFLNRAGGIGANFAGTSADFRAVATLDVRQFAPSVPLRFHFNFGYFLDNSAQLVQDVEHARSMATPGYNAATCTPGPGNLATDRTSAYNNDPACHAEISRDERFALGINRSDRLNIGIATDILAPIPYFPTLFFIEWNLGIPIVRSGYVCWNANQPLLSGGTDDDLCLGGTGGGNRFMAGSPAINTFAVMPSTLTLGARINTPARALSALLAVDIASGGAFAPFVREVAPITPWQFFFGLNFAHDFAPQIRRVEVPREVVREVARDSSPMRGNIVGLVADAETHAPIANAVVELVGHADIGLSATDATGHYRTHAVAPGDYQVHVRATDYNDNTCRGSVATPTGDARTAPDVTVDCALRPVPRMGNVAGHVVSSANNQPVGGVTVTLSPGQGIVVPQGQTAPSTQMTTTGADGAFHFESLPSGQYNVSAGQGPTTRAGSPQSVDIRPRETAQAEIHVAAVDNSGIHITRGSIDVRDQIHFQTDSAEILPDSNTLIERIADFMNRHPEAERIEIQGHTDNQGTAPHNQTLSQSRAESVRAALVNLGVSPDRLVGHGYGQTRPIAPNLTAAGRARNRRVMFVITHRVGAPAGAGAPAGGAAHPLGGAAGAHPAGAAGAHPAGAAAHPTGGMAHPPPPAAR